MSGKKVVVLGDITLDENIYKGDRKSPDEKKNGTIIRKSPGGAYLLHDYISSFILEANRHSPQKQNEDHLCSFFPVFEISEIPEPFMSYALWERASQPKKKQKPEKQAQKGEPDKEKHHWGLSSALGYGRVAQQSDYFLTQKIVPEQLPKEIDILVLDDSGTLFHQADKLWTPALQRLTAKKKHSKPWIVLKCCFPLAKGNLFKELTAKYAEDLVIITSIDEIRKEDALISKGVSWEQTALDLVLELSTNPTLKRLLNCKYLIVTLQSEGALYLEIKDKTIWKCRLLFDPEFLEGEWNPDDGIVHRVIGLMSCFTAAIAYSLLEDEINLENILTRGLAAMRRYKLLGHIAVPDGEPAFPYTEVAQELFVPQLSFASAFVPIPGVALAHNPASSTHCPISTSYCGNPRPTNFRSSNWTILEGRYMLDSQLEPLYDTGLRLALEGEGVMANTPKLSIGILTTFDRKEIEALRNLQNLIRDYRNNDKGSKPLSIAVFGTPGSGKSFAVKQLSEHLDMPFLEFNLSQFSSEKELEGAFHQVRDCVLKGKTPCVFWDEFDSQNYKWLQYLLAPMQDGKFQEGQLTHPIGKCVFIFAGGTSYTFETFGIKKPCEPDPKKSNPSMDKEYQEQLSRFREFKTSKGPDFKSRLHGYINVLGPNPRNCLNENGEIRRDASGAEITDKEDVFFPIRRAMFIRSILGVKKNERLNIDLGLLYALVRIPKYEHGSRTLEQILRQIQAQGNSHRFLRSGLPSSSNMAMLVNYDEFLKLMHEDHSADFLAFEIAPCIHANWCDIAAKDENRIYYHKLFNQLPAHMQLENIEAAKRIPRLLEKLGLCMVPEDEREFHLPADDTSLEKLMPKKNDTLAQLEHKGWIETKEAQGWSYSECRNDDRKLHDTMLPWKTKGKSLPDPEKDKDRDAVAKIPAVLQKARYAIVRKPQYNDR